MKRFKFKLDSALSLRSFRKQEAARVFMDATRVRVECQERLELEEQGRAKAESQVIPGRGVRVTADEMVRRQAAVAYYRDQVRLRSEKLKQALEVEDQCYRELLLAKQEEEGLLRLKEKAREAHRNEMIQSDERAMEEFVNARQRSALV